MVFFFFLGIRNVTSTGPFPTQGSKNHRMKQSTINVILASFQQSIENYSSTYLLLVDTNFWSQSCLVNPTFAPVC